MRERERTGLEGSSVAGLEGVEDRVGRVKGGEGELGGLCRLVDLVLPLIVHLE